MSMDNEHLAHRLDEEFKIGLAEIRKYILKLRFLDDAILCRLWIDKLFHSTDQRVLRNDFLKDLTEHVKEGELKYPFNSPPSQYSLSYIKAGGEGDCIQGKCSYGSSSLYSEDHSLLPTHRVCTTNAQRYKASCSSKKTIPPIQRGRSEPYMLTRWKKEPEELTLNFELKEDNIVGYKKNEAMLETNDQKSQSLLITIASLEAQNEALLHEVSLYQENNEVVQRNFQAVNEEVVVLRTKLGELQKINTSIEKSHVVAISDYRKALTDTLGQVSDRLREVSERNDELGNNIASLESKLSQGDHQVISEDVEKKLKIEISQLKYGLSLERKKHKAEILDLQSVVTQKEHQLKRVDGQVKKQCSRMEEEVSHIKLEMDHVASETQSQLNSKVHNLQKDVRKLENTNKKLIAKYELRLNVCQKECEKKLENMKSKTFHSVEKGSELEKAVIELERRYKRLVSEIENRAATQQKRDAERIRELELQLINYKKSKSLCGPVKK